MFFFPSCLMYVYYIVGTILQIHAAELVPFGEKFPTLALCFVTLTIELNCTRISLTFVQEFFIVRKIFLDHFQV